MVWKIDSISPTVLLIWVSSISPRKVDSIFLASLWMTAILCCSSLSSQLDLAETKAVLCLFFLWSFSDLSPSPFLLIYVIFVSTILMPSRTFILVFFVFLILSMYSCLKYFLANSPSSLCLGMPDCRISSLPRFRFTQNSYHSTCNAILHVPIPCCRLQ